MATRAATHSGGENGIKNRRHRTPVGHICRGLNRHWRFDSRVRIVTFNLEVFKAVVEDRRGLAFDDQLRQRTRFAAQLQIGLLEMVAVQMGIATGPDEIADLQIALLRHHMHQQRVAGDVERQAEEDVAGALIQLAGELAVGDIELEEGVARRRAILSSSPTFHAETMIRRESGSFFSWSITVLIWSI